MYTVYAQQIDNLTGHKRDVKQSSKFHFPIKVSFMFNQHLALNNTHNNLP
ncbi:Uncharacterised protein [Bacteroides intestinalis]|uniref:Uncharacterized protein n=1 Tax=Bacteroides intestinalis TaxID=329854 RepID=A0A6N2U400_9BACE